MRLRKGWLKNQMQKAADEVKNWPAWMVELDELDTKMEDQREGK